jgi:hypothetical protein
MADLENAAILPPQHVKQPTEPEPSQSALIERLGSGKYKKYARFVVAAVSAIPWIGGVIGAAASFSAERDQEGVNDLHRLKTYIRYWLPGMNSSRHFGQRLDLLRISLIRHLLSAEAGALL